MTRAEPRHRRSRFSWPTTTEPTTTSAGTHDHGLKTTPIGMALLALVLLFFVNAAFLVYILVARESRNVQQEQVQQQIRDSWCSALDAFPQKNYFLDPLRKQYNCGPGLPLESYPPEIQDGLNGGSSAPATPTAPPGVEVAPDGYDFSGGASAGLPTEVPHYPTPGSTEPEPTAPVPSGFPPPDPDQP